MRILGDVPASEFGENHYKRYARERKKQLDQQAPEQAAEWWLQVSRATVLDWLRASKLHGSKLAYRTWRITTAEIEAFLKRQQPETRGAQGA